MSNDGCSSSVMWLLKLAFFFVDCSCGCCGVLYLLGAIPCATFVGYLPET